MNNSMNDFFDEARALDKSEISRLSVAHVLEAAESCVVFVQKYWKASDGLPGLEVTSSQLPATVADEIRALLGIVRSLHNESRMRQPGPSPACLVEKRAALLARRIAKACEYALGPDAAVAPDSPIKMLKCRRLDATRESRIEYLFGLHAVGMRMLPQLATIATFEATWLDELYECATKLSAYGPARRGRPPNPDIELRNRMLTLLLRRVFQVRRCAAFVFDEYPEVLHQLALAYKKRVRGDGRKARRSVRARQNGWSEKR